MQRTVLEFEIMSFSTYSGVQPSFKNNSDTIKWELGVWTYTLLGGTEVALRRLWPTNF